MTDNDYEVFGDLMLSWGEISSGNEEMRTPSHLKIDTYFKFLKELSLNEICENVKKHFDKNKWFPAICELRNENGTLDAAAIEAYNTIEELMDSLYDPMIGIPCLNAMNERLETIGKAYLKPILMKWGTEIWSRQNITATRAQFIKAFPVETKGIDTSRQIEMKKPKLIAQGVSVTVTELQERLKLVRERNIERKQLEEHKENIFEQQRIKLNEVMSELHKESEANLISDVQTAT